MKHELYCVSNEEILSKIKQLRARIPEIIERDKKFNNDYYLHRWLLSRQCKVDRTAASIREAIAWREKINYEQMTGSNWNYCPAEIFKETPVSMEVHEANGKPVITLNCNGLNVHAAVQRFGKNTAVMYLTEMFAKVERVLINHYVSTSTNSSVQEQEEHYIPHSSAVTIVATFKDFSIWNATSLEIVQMFIEAATNGIKYFPCMASALYLVNVNKFSATLFKLVKPIMSGQPYFVGCYSSDRKKWPNELLNLIEQLPNFNTEADSL